MSDPVLGNAARWHSTSPLYGEELHMLAHVWWHGNMWAHRGAAGLLSDAVARAHLVGSGDASRHDL